MPPENRKISISDIKKKIEEPGRKPPVISPFISPERKTEPKNAGPISASPGFNAGRGSGDGISKPLSPLSKTIKKPAAKDVTAKSSRPEPLPVHGPAAQKSSWFFGKKKAPEKPEDFLKLYEKPPRKFSPKKGLFWSAALVIIFALGVSFLHFFAYAKVSVTPKQEFVEVDTTIRASSNSASDIALEFITFEDTLSFSKKISGVEKVEDKARGQVIIFNGFSTAGQVLVATTRLEAPNGNIYRIEKQVTVPGAKMENGKLVPQGVEVTAIADKAGKEYNLGLSDFKIPGFQGSPRYDKFFARSKTEITGGFVGERPKVSDEDLTALMAQANEVFKSTFMDKIKKDLPAGVFLPEGAYEITSLIDSAEATANDDEDSKVAVKGTLKGLALKESDVSDHLGQSYLGLKEGEEVLVENRDKLAYEIISKDFDRKVLSFKVKGRAHFVWKFNENVLKDDLLAVGKNRRDAFQKHSSIERAEINFVPGWWRVFPENPSRIRVERMLKSE